MMRAISGKEDVRLVTSWRSRPLTWWLYYERVCRSRSGTNFGVANSSSEQPRVDKGAADERRRQHCHRRCTTRYRAPPPTDQRAESQHAENVAEDPGPLGHSFMELDVVVSNSGHSFYRILRCIAAEISRVTGDGGYDENHQCRAPENVGRCEVRHDEKRKREKAPEDRCVVYQQVEVCACKHGLGYWVVPDVRKLGAADAGNV